MLKDTDRAALKDIAESDIKEIRVNGNDAFTETGSYTTAVVSRLVAMTALREIETVGKVTRYELTSTGRHLLTNPEVEAQLVVALGLSSY